MKKRNAAAVLASLAVCANSLGITAFAEETGIRNESAESFFGEGEHILSQSLDIGTYDLMRASIEEPVYLDYANEDLDVQTVDPLQLQNYFGANSYNYYNILTASQQQAYRDMLAALIANPATATADTTCNDWNDVARAFCAMVLDYPEFTALSSIGGSVYSNSITVKFKYCSGQTSSNVSSCYSAVQNKVASLKSSSSAYPSDYAKLKFFSEYLCDNVTYNNSAAATGVGDNCWNAYGSLINGSGVCESYAEGLKLLCDSVSIPCILVVSDTHEWNAVYMDGGWYYVDTTWMDTKITGRYDYSWFMVGTDTTAKQDPNSDHVLSDEAVLGGGVSKLVYPRISTSDYEYVEIEFDETKAGEFVERLYQNMLGRSSDPVGKANHIKNLKNGKSAVNVAKDFVFSNELKNMKLSNSDFVKRMYVTFLDRSADPSGLAGWTKKLDNGCSYGYILKGFSGSDEFTAICSKYGIVRGTYTVTENRDKNANLTAYVSRMYTKALGRSYDVKGLNNHTGRYLSGARSAEGIAHDFIFSAEFVNRNLSNEQYVTCLYNTLFDRGPDSTGYNKWVNALKNGTSREEVFKGFTGAQEFKNLVAGFGL